MMVYAISLLLGFPIALIFLNEISQRTAIPKPRVSQVVRMVRDTVLPLLAATLFAHFVAGYPYESILVRSLFTVTLIVALNAAIATLNLFLSGGQQRIPNLLLDLIRISLVLAGTAIIIASVWQQDLGELLTALGVGGVVIGLALQGTLSNLFSGLSLLSEQAVKVDDWVRVDGVEGRVTKVTWRSLSIETYEYTTVIISNNGLAGTQIEKLTRADGLTEMQLKIEVIPDVPPETIKAAFMEAAAACQHVAPEFVVTFEGYTPRGIDVEMALLLPDFAKRDAVLSQFNSLVWYACQRRGVTIAGSTFRHYDVRPPEMIEGRTTQARLDMLTDSNALPLSMDTLESIAEKSYFAHWRKGELLLGHGLKADGLFILLVGRVSIEIVNDGHRVEIDMLRDGQVYGLSSTLKNGLSLVNAVATTGATAIHLPSAAAETLMATHPDFARFVDNLIENYDLDIDEHDPASKRQRAVAKSSNNAPTHLSN